MFEVVHNFLSKLLDVSYASTYYYKNNYGKFHAIKCVNNILKNKRSQLE